MSLLRRALAIVLVAIGIGAATLPPAPAAAWTLWERTAYKTLTYEAMHNAFDLTLYGSLLGGSLVGSPVFLGTNAAMSAAVYYAHEYAWESASPSNEPFTDWTTLSKLVTYRVATTVKNIGLGLMFTGDPTLATGFAVISAVADTGFYLANEWGWGAWQPPGAPAVEPPSRIAQTRTLDAHDRLEIGRGAPISMAY